MVCVILYIQKVFTLDFLVDITQMNEFAQLLDYIFHKYIPLHKRKLFYHNTEREKKLSRQSKVNLDTIQCSPIWQETAKPYKVSFNPC